MRRSAIARISSSPSATARSPACCRLCRCARCCSATRWSPARSASMAARWRPTRKAPPRWTPMRPTCCAAAARARWSSAIASRRRADWVRRADLYVTFRKPIGADHDRNMKAIPRKQRAMVRKGIENGLTSVCNRDVRRCTGSTPKACATSARRCFRAAISASCRAFRDGADIVTVMDEDQPIASVMNFYFRDEVLPVLRRRHRGGAPSGRQRFHVLGGDAPRRRSRLPAVRFRPQQARHRRVMRSSRTGDSSRRRCLIATGSRPAPRSPTIIRSIRNTACSSPPGSGCHCRSPTCSARKSCGAWADDRCVIRSPHRAVRPLRRTRPRHRRCSKACMPGLIGIFWEPVG